MNEDRYYAAQQGIHKALESIELMQEEDGHDWHEEVRRLLLKCSSRLMIEVCRPEGGKQ